jgi:peroxiredoxin Q/BCP
MWPTIGKCRANLVREGVGLDTYVQLRDGRRRGDRHRRDCVPDALGWARVRAQRRARERVIEVGDQAPEFSLPDQDGREVRLSDLRGQTVVLYFYPKAETPGCTTQACGVRDHRSQYAVAGATVLAVSPDPVAKLKRFDERHNLGFALLSDSDHAVANSYGVWVKKSMYGRSYLGNERSTFVIAPDGRVAGVLRKVKPAEHDKLVLQAVEQA